MSFLNPFLLLGVLGLSLPILAHLLNRYQVRHTDWAAMRFLNRSVRVRSRQLKLRDILLLMLRCLAVLLIVVAFSRPSLRQPNRIIGSVGEARTGVIIALDASFSMGVRDGDRSRFDKAVDSARRIVQGLQVGDRVTLVLMSGEHRVLVRNIMFDSEVLVAALDALKVTDESLNLNRLPERLGTLLDEMKVPQKEIYIITDMQAADWSLGANRLRDALAAVASRSTVMIVPVTGGVENLAVTGFELVSGVLRKGTTARYQATVHNFGTTVARQVSIRGRVNNITVDVKVIPSIAPGTSASVSLFLPFRDPGAMRLVAVLEWDQDTLDADNTRRTVAVIRDNVSILCVEGTSESSDAAGNLIRAALQARGDAKRQDELEVQSVSWVELPSQDLSLFDVVILADVPDVTEQQARALDAYVREGNSLIWFGGEYVKADIWNQRSALGETPLLPAVIEGRMRAGDVMGIGRPLDPSVSDHPVCRPLRSLPEDLLSETRFHTLLEVMPSATSATPLRLAGSDAPVLLEHALGRGYVFMFTTSAGPVWNNMSVTPVFPMLLQQIVTYLTAREFEAPRTVGDALYLTYVDQPDASDAVFDTPSGEMISVPVRAYRGRYVALLDRTAEAGFYLARVSLQSDGIPVAVNVNTQESAIGGLDPRMISETFSERSVRVVTGQDEILELPNEIRLQRSYGRFLMLAGLAFLIIEAAVAERSYRRLRRSHPVKLQGQRI